MMTLIAGLFFIAAIVLSISEAWIEKDWPTHTFRFVLIFGVIFWMWISM